MKIKKIHRIGVLLTIMALFVTALGGTMVYAMDGSTSSTSSSADYGVFGKQTRDGLKRNALLTSGQYGDLGWGSFNTYNYYRIYGSDDAGFESDTICASINADGSFATTVTLPTGGTWHYVDTLIPEQYSELFDITKTSDKITFDLKTCHTCTNYSYSGGKYVS